jgi:hypothetical protein
MQKFVHKSQHTVQHYGLSIWQLFFGPPVARPSALRAVFFDSCYLHSAILIKARLHMYAMPRPQCLRHVMDLHATMD